MAGDNPAWSQGTGTSQAVQEQAGQVELIEDSVEELT